MMRLSRRDYLGCSVRMDLKTVNLKPGELFRRLIIIVKHNEEEYHMEEEYGGIRNQPG